MTKKSEKQYSDLVKTLKKLSSPERAKSSKWFFKTGQGQYGEGDVFIGIRVPLLREVAKQCVRLSLKDIAKLLKSPIHEYRFVGLEILVIQFEQGTNVDKKRIAEFYLANTSAVNSWDLVDTSAPYILGAHLLQKNKSILRQLARSKNIWERRIAIVSTQTFIRQQKYAETLALAKILLHDSHDLIHKAVGWMLREIGNRSLVTEREFLDAYYKVMPRTMLRYAIEKFPGKLRKKYLGR